MAGIRSKPLGRNTDAAVPTTGTAFLLPTTVNTWQVKIYVSAQAYVGMGLVATPIPAAATTNSVYQEANTEVVYTLDGVAQTDGYYMYVYAVTGTIDAHLSYFG